MRLFTENENIDVSIFDPKTFIFIENKIFMALAGTGLPPGHTTTLYKKKKGSIGRYINEKWEYINDDRNQLFYFKNNGKEYKTTQINEVPDPHIFTKIKPPEIEKQNQKVIFITENQNWLVGLDWYEKPVWNSAQEMSYCVTDFFIPNNQFTNIAPPKKYLILDELGHWIEPKPKPEQLIPEIKPE